MNNILMIPGPTDLEHMLYLSLKMTPCRCTEAKWWDKAKRPDKKCGRCMALETYEATYPGYTV